MSARRSSALTEGRGADLVIRGRLGARHRGAGHRAARGRARESCCSRRPPHTERIEASGADICVGERTLFGCYSASVDLQTESADLVFSGELPVEELISHRLPLDENPIRI